MANRVINLSKESIKAHIRGLEKLRLFLMGLTYNNEFTNETDFLKHSIEVLAETQIDLHELVKALETVE